MTIRWLFTVLATGLLAAGASAESPSRTKSEAMAWAVEWLEREYRWETRYEYVMGGEVRLLLMWVGEDDVGGGYIRFAESPARAIELVLGSQPDKAPRGINRWGAVMEVLYGEDNPSAPLATAALGFRRKVSAPETVPEEGQSAPSADGEDLFEASLNYIERSVGYAALSEFRTGRAFDISHFPRVKEMTLSDLAGRSSGVRSLSEDQAEACGRVSSFLFTVERAIDDVIRGKPVRPWCYVYNAQLYTLELISNERVDQRQIEITLENGDRIRKSYQGLVDTEFRVVNQVSGNQTLFRLLLGTKEPYRGVPIQIVHSPNWWARITLDLEDITRPSLTP